jgi:hypothetical protein
VLVTGLAGLLAGPCRWVPAITSRCVRSASCWRPRPRIRALVVTVLVGIGMTLLLRERTSLLIAQLEDEHDWESLKRH